MYFLACQSFFFYLFIFKSIARGFLQKNTMSAHTSTTDASLLTSKDYYFDSYAHFGKKFSLVL